MDLCKPLISCESDYGGSVAFSPSDAAMPVFDELLDAVKIAFGHLADKS
jgi:hypothetical protein